MWEYKDLIEKYPDLKDVMGENVLEHLKACSKKTVKHLSALWRGNIKANVRAHYKKCGLVNFEMAGFGKNKATIGIGAGPSLKKNWATLKKVCLAEAATPWPERDFITVASNHQVKRCIEEGLWPDFAIVIDGSPRLVKQMCCGKKSRYTTLLASINTHPDVVASWQGPVRFLVSKSMASMFEEATGEHYSDSHYITDGGNVMNALWLLSVGLWRSSVFITVGNDLSFPAAEKLEERRKSFYADGNYITNKTSKRDEACHTLAWMGIEYPGNKVISNIDYVNFNLVYTSPQLYTYKVWLETNARVLAGGTQKFVIYNCTEGGILGVQRRVDKDYEDPNSWYLYDERLKGTWRTRQLKQAVAEFVSAKERLRTVYDVLGAGDLVRPH